MSTTEGFYFKEEVKSGLQSFTDYNHKKKYDEKIDVYAIGIALYELAIPGEFTGVRFDKIDSLKASASFKELLRGSLDPSPLKRLSMEALISHPFFADPDALSKAYATITILGSGGFGKVSKVYYPSTQEVFALKQIPKSSKSCHDLHLHVISELETLYMLTNKKKKKAICLEAGTDSADYFVKIIDHFFDQECLYIVMEYCDGKDLRSKMKQKIFTLEEIQDIGRQLITALSILHSEGIVHEDLKPENILFKSVSTKLWFCRGLVQNFMLFSLYTSLNSNWRISEFR